MSDQVADHFMIRTDAQSSLHRRPLKPRVLKSIYIVILLLIYASLNYANPDMPVLDKFTRYF